MATSADAIRTDGLKSTQKNENICVADLSPMNVVTLRTQTGLGGGAEEVSIQLGAWDVIQTSSSFGEPSEAWSPGKIDLDSNFPIQGKK